MKKIGLIANPNAGRQLAKQKSEELRDIMSARGVRMDIHFTLPDEDLTPVVEEYAINATQLVIMGGDGTVNQVVNGLMKIEKRVPLAIYPMGTVNDFATYLNIPQNIRLFANMLEDSHVMMVDLGKVGNRYFLNVAAGGLLPELAHKVSSQSKTVLGKFAYYIEGIREFPKQFFHPIPIQLDIAGQVVEKKILFFLASNSPYVGGFRNLVPKAKIDDGLIELLIVESVDLPDVANVFLNILRRQMDHDLEPVKGISYYRVHQFKMNSSEVVDVDVDGELGGYLPLTFTMLPRTIPMIVPSEDKRKRNLFT